MRSLVALLLGGVVLVAAGPEARAQTDRDIDLTTLRFPPGRDAVIGAEGTALTAPRRVTLGAALRWTDRPLVLREASGEESAALVQGRFNLDVGLAVGVLPWLELGLSFPTVLYQDGESDTPVGSLSALASVGTGDLRVRAKVAILSSATRIFGLGFVLEGSFPTALRGSFLGDGAPGLEALVIGDFRLLRWHVVLALGYRLRPERHFGDLDVDDELLWRFGIRVGLPLDFAVLADISGAHGLLGPDGPFGAQDENPIVWHLALDLPAVRDVRITLGSGMGVTSGYGAPRFDLFASMRFEPHDHDTDGDEIFDHADQCPEIPEDLDEFEDEDGCPDDDNDQDGVQDFIDLCPNEAEDLDGWDDADGCPETDVDGDGIDDPGDRCPDEREDADGFQDADGCPDPDVDGDGIDDPADRCPRDAEDVDRFEDGDGCPDGDNDGDGIDDDDDRCTDAPEDLDGFEDEDGCPDDDNDQDGVIDVQDRCPLEAEDVDGHEDADGCSEPGGRIRPVRP
jgi:hypothetical protein